MRRAILLGLVLLVAGAFALLFLQAREPAADARDPGGFDLFAFFEGASVSRGEVVTLAVRREAFTALFSGERDGETFTLAERFAFPAGERLQVWRLRAVPGGYAGTVETEQGEGGLAPPAPVVGVADGTAIALSYRGVAPGGGVPLEFRHRMRMRADGTVSNHVVVRRFGIPLATSGVVFAKTPAALSSTTLRR